MLVDRLYDTDLATVATMCGNVSTYTIYYMVLDKLRMLMRRAVYTFRELAKDIPVSEQASGKGLASESSYCTGVVTRPMVYNCFSTIACGGTSVTRRILGREVCDFQHLESHYAEPNRGVRDQAVHHPCGTPPEGH